MPPYSEARKAWHRDYIREVWYPQNREAHIARVRRNEVLRWVRIQTRIDEIKNQPCTDCHQSFDPVCMDFDHIDPTTKLFNIANFKQYGWAKISAEIAKCEVVCSNCHRLRTKQRRLASTEPDVVWLREINGAG